MYLCSQIGSVYTQIGGNQCLLLPVRFEPFRKVWAGREIGRRRRREDGVGAKRRIEDGCGSDMGSRRVCWVWVVWREEGYIAVLWGEGDELEGRD